MADGRVRFGSRDYHTPLYICHIDVFLDEDLVFTTLTLVLRLHLLQVSSYLHSTIANRTDRN